VAAPGDDAGRILRSRAASFSEVEGTGCLGDPQPAPEAEGSAAFPPRTSMVLHPRQTPIVPTVHLNYRYFRSGSGLVVSAAG